MSEARLTGAEAGAKDNYEPLEDLQITVSAELDCQIMPFEKLLNLRVNSILPLGRATGENLDVFAEDILFGSAEILLVDSRLAVRLADLNDKQAKEKEEGTRP